MSLKSKLVIFCVVAACLVAVIFVTSGREKKALLGDVTQAPPAAVTVIKAATRAMTGTAAVTGTLVPREEILIGAEAEGLRITAIYADEGDTVKKGQKLASLARDLIDAQVAQNHASQAQAASQIESAKATLEQAQAALNRAQILKNEGYTTQAVLDERIAATRTAAAQLAVTQENLNLVQAQGNELSGQLSRRQLVSPVDGVVSRRTARLGQVVSSAAEPVFRIIEDGAIELLADVPEQNLLSITTGQKASVTLDNGQVFEGTVRLVSPEIDTATRLGRVRVALGNEPALKIGAFARGSIVTATHSALVIPSKAVMHGEGGASVMVANGNTVQFRKVETGIIEGNDVEITNGLREGELVIEKAGTFLRDGDPIAPVEAGAEPPDKPAPSDAE